MSPTPEKADPNICYSTSAFPGEPTYHCSIAGWHPHMLHDDGERHRWFDAIPDLPIHAYEAELLGRLAVLERDAERAADAAVKAAREAAHGFVTTGHQNTDRVLREQAGWNARTFDDLRLAELRRQADAKIREIAANVQMPQNYWPAEYASLEDLTAELRRLDHALANVRMLSTPYPRSEATLRKRREAVRKAREKREAVEAWYGAIVPQYPYLNPPQPGFPFVTSAEAPAEREAEAYRAEAVEKVVAATPLPLNGEVRTTSSTGGQKGMKPARFDLIPVMPLTRLAEHYGIGAAKYADHNWRKGYEISKNYAALQRHVTAFWDGEDLDPETGSPHLSAVIFHAMAMQQNLQDFPQHDDRYKKEA